MPSSDGPRIPDAYDKLADEYAQRVDEKPYNADLDYPAVTALMPEVRGKNVLDAGCGSGRYTAWLLDNGAEVTAIDVSEKIITHTKDRVGEHADVRQADLGEPLQFAAKGEFDVILSALTIHYVHDWRQMLSEFQRILKPDGIFVCSIYHPSTITAD